MANTEKQVSPEEKLLNVIQSNGKQEDNKIKTEPAPAKAAGAPAPVQPVPPKTVPAVQAFAKAQEPQKAEKPKLKLATGPQTSDEVSRVKSQGGQPESPVSETKKQPANLDKKEEKPSKSQPKAKQDIGASPAPVSASVPGMAIRKKTKRKFSLSSVNQILAVVIFVVLCFAGIEIFAAIKTERRSEPKNTQPEINPRIDIGRMMTAEELMPLISSDIWIRQPNISTGTSIVTNIQTTAWMDYMRKNIKLMGVSVKDNEADTEAIFNDKEAKTMFYLKRGETTQINGVNVRLEVIEGDRVKLSDGKQSLDIK